MTNATATPAATVHVFAHLAPAPYRYLRFEVRTYQACHGAPVQVGTICDHCGTGIKDTFWFSGADGVEFKVGNQCVTKSGDEGLRKVIAPEVNRIKRERKAARDGERIRLGLLLLVEHRATFDNAPHPFAGSSWAADKTLADYLFWMFENSGTAGRIRACKIIEARTK